MSNTTFSGVSSGLASLGFSGAGHNLVFIDCEARWNHQPSISQMVHDNPARARVLEAYGVGYCCCGGVHTLTETCEAQKLDEEQLREDLAHIDSLPWQRTQDEHDWSDTSPQRLAMHILQVHHEWLSTEIARVEKLLARIAEKHGELFPELWQAYGLFSELKREVLAHMATETMAFRRLAFPQIAVEEALVATTDLHQVEVFAHQHDELFKVLDHIRELLHGYVVPDGACPTYRVMLHSLAGLDAELRHCMREETQLFELIECGG